MDALSSMRGVTSRVTQSLAASAADMSLARVLAPVSADLAELDKRFRDFLVSDSATSGQIIDYVIASGGKKIRPALYFFVARMLGYRGESLYPIAAVSEMVHAASLLHDDVVDNSTLRRNKPTPNSIWGDETAVLAGDLIYARASELMAETGSLEIVKLFARAIRLMSEGELIQLETLFKVDTARETYFRILTCKTATLIGAACRSAGVLAGVSTEHREALATFGESAGIAFQLIDDALDYGLSRDKLGKPTLTDLKDGKVTMPVILLRERCSAEELLRLSNIFTTGALHHDDLLWVSDLVQKYDAATKTVDLANDYTKRAVDSLRIFPESSERRDLEMLALKLVSRLQ